MRSLRKPVALCLDLGPQGQVGPRAAEAHGDEEMGADEECCLAIADLLALPQLGGAGDDEQRPAIDLDLGQLAGIEGILHGQRVQAILAAHEIHLGHVRLAQADPVKGVGRKVGYALAGQCKGFIVSGAIAVAAGGGR